MQSNKTYFEKLNSMGANGNPFLFIIDYEMKKPLVFSLDEIPTNLCFSVPGYTNSESPDTKFDDQIIFQKEVVSINHYNKAFELVQSHLNYGNSYLLNLTQESKITSNLTLQNIYDYSHALFKLKYLDDFVCFSPEIFVRIKDGLISSYPMKGTIDARIENAAEKIIKSNKEFAEHNTIVDLIRNDLSMVSKKVRVEKFRYIDKIETNEGELLQVSSEIVGELPSDYPENIGNILQKLLPAGSICGAPKKKTVEIIKEAENYDRGFYTGIFGVFDGKNLESGVMIRFIEKKDDQLYFKSGGGITALSILDEEYQELIDKVYVPFTGKH